MDFWNLEQHIPNYTFSKQDVGGLHNVVGLIDMMFDIILECSKLLIFFLIIEDNKFPSEKVWLLKTLPARENSFQGTTAWNLRITGFSVKAILTNC